MDKQTTGLLVTGFIMLIIMMILVQVGAIQVVNSITGITKKLYEHPFAVSNKVLEVNSDIIAMHRYMKDVALAKNTKELESAISSVDSHEANINRHFDLIKIRFLGDKARIEKAYLLFSNWKPIRSEVIELMQKGQNEEAALITKGKGARYVKTLTKEMAGLIQFARNKADEFVANSNIQQENSRIILYGLMSVILVMGLIIAYFVIRKVSESAKALRDSEERWQLALKGSRDGVWDWNIQTGDLFWSDGVAPLFGYSVGDLETTYENFVSAIFPDDQENVLFAINDCIENGTDYNIEHRVIWPDGQVRWVHETGDVVRNDKGIALKMVGVIQDIHLRKEAEYALRESEEKYRCLFELSEDPMWIISDEQFVLANKAAAKILGYKNAVDLKNIHPSILSPEYQPDKQLSFIKANEMMTIAYRNGYHRFEWFHTNKNGQDFPTEVTLTRIPFEGGSALFCVWRDITENKFQQLNLEIAKEEAEKANKAKSEFLSSMSHELRTPLNAILGFSQLLMLDEIQPLTLDQKENTEQIIQGGEHLLKLINDVLDLAKIESGNVDYSLEPISVKDLISDVLALVQPIISNYKVEIESDCQCKDAGDVIIYADFLRTKQILLNLISNAAKYNKKDGRIQVCCNIVFNEQLRITVTDEGKGISHKMQGELFKPFSRLGAENSNIEGTGIGLVVCKELIESMNGRIGFESEVGQGSSFWIELPLSVSITEETYDVAEEQKHIFPTLEGTVLYIEDSPANLKLMEVLILRTEGLQLLTATTAEEGLDIAEEKQPNIILMDINLPNMSGIEAVKHLKNNPKTSCIPVLALSAAATTDNISQSKDVGFEQYLTKPMDVNDILDSIYNILGKKE